MLLPHPIVYRLIERRNYNAVQDSGAPLQPLDCHCRKMVNRIATSFTGSNVPDTSAPPAFACLKSVNLAVSFRSVLEGRKHAVEHVRTPFRKSCYWPCPSFTSSNGGSDRSYEQLNSDTEAHRAGCRTPTGRYAYSAREARLLGSRLILIVHGGEP
jgi:hypothetical protein